MLVIQHKVLNDHLKVTLEIWICSAKDPICSEPCVNCTLISIEITVKIHGDFGVNPETLQMHSCSE